jgi:hypothetical protein
MDSGFNECWKILDSRNQNILLEAVSNILISLEMNAFRHQLRSKNLISNQFFDKQPKYIFEQHVKTNRRKLQHQKKNFISLTKHPNFFLQKEVP